VLEHLILCLLLTVVTIGALLNLIGVNWSEQKAGGGKVFGVLLDILKIAFEYTWKILWHLIQWLTWFLPELLKFLKDALKMLVVIRRGK